jgi:hypothetical protein
MLAGGPSLLLGQLGVPRRSSGGLLVWPGDAALTEDPLCWLSRPVISGIAAATLPLAAKSGSVGDRVLAGVQRIEQADADAGGCLVRTTAKWASAQSSSPPSDWVASLCCCKSGSR